MIDAKVSFMNQLTEQMSDVLTVDQTEKLKKSVRDLLETFEMYEHGTESGPDAGLLRRGHEGRVPEPEND